MDSRTELDRQIATARERLAQAKDGDRAFLLGEEIKRLQILRRTRRPEGETDK
jgi:hypothetical protein